MSRFTLAGLCIFAVGCQPESAREGAQTSVTNPEIASPTLETSNGSRRSLWTQHYRVASTAEPFSSVESTYPHAAIIAEHLPGKLAGLIAEPAIVIYEMPSEQFSWAKYNAKTILVCFTELLKRYERGGVPRAVLEPYYRYQLLHRSEVLGDLMFNRSTAGGIRDGLKFAWMYRRYPVLLMRSLLIACAHPQAPKLLSVPLRAWLKRRSQR